jgi:DNA repair protein RadC
MLHEENADYRKKLLMRYLKNDSLESFLDDEILELLLSVTMPNRNIKSISKSLLKKYKGLEEMQRASIQDLISHNGMNAEAAILLKIFKEASIVLLKKQMKKNVYNKLNYLNYLKMYLKGAKDENFVVAFLNTHSKIIEIEVIHVGSVDRIVVHPRKVIERALYFNAVALILAHNHPGGEVRPSLADKEMTRLITNAANSIDIDVYDHYIISQNEHFSFKDKGLI